jgi:hypothetical protein
MAKTAKKSTNPIKDGPKGMPPGAARAMSKKPPTDAKGASPAIEAARRLMQGGKYDTSK